MVMKAGIKGHFNHAWIIFQNEIILKQIWNLWNDDTKFLCRCQRFMVCLVIILCKWSKYISLTLRLGLLCPRVDHEWREDTAQTDESESNYTLSQLAGFSAFEFWAGWLSTSQIPQRETNDASSVYLVAMFLYYRPSRPTDQARSVLSGLPRDSSRTFFFFTFEVTFDQADKADWTSASERLTDD